MPSSTSTISPSSHLAEALKNLDPSPSDMDYDEDKEFNFMNSNKNLLNSTEQTVYVVRSPAFAKRRAVLLSPFSQNDHQYYNVSYIVPKFGDIPMNYIPDDSNQFIPIQVLADRHRSAYVRELPL